MQGSANLNVMIKAARIAARSLGKDFREVENLQVSSKGASDFVSKADIRAEEIIKEMLMEARPTYGWLGEESEPVAGEDPTRRWIVDPLDGTTNFLHGLPHWAVSIALEHKGEIVAAVIFDPAKGELFGAEKGNGAFMNDQRLRVSDRSKLSESVGVRRFGSASLDLAYVAAGRYEGFWERGLKAWDLAAGLLIVKEAGGLVETLEGPGNPVETGDVLCANDLIFEKFSKIIREK